MSTRTHHIGAPADHAGAPADHSARDPKVST